jgi:hypothetical protein
LACARGQIIRIPVERPEPSSEPDDFDLLHDYCIRDLQDAYDFETEKREMFDLSFVDTEIEKAIDSALKFGIEQMENPAATVPGIVVGVIREMLLGIPHSISMPKAHCAAIPDRWRKFEMS